MNSEALKQILAAYGRLLLLGVAVLCGAGALAAAGYAIVTQARVHAALKVGEELGSKPEATPTPAPTPRPPAQLPEALSQLMLAKRVFGPPPAGPPQVTSVLGDSALINGQWMKVGVKQGDIEVKEILPNKVIFEFQGNRQEATLFQALPTQPLERGALQRPTPKPSPTPAAAETTTGAGTQTLTQNTAATVTQQATPPTPIVKTTPATPATQTPGKDGKNP